MSTLSRATAEESRRAFEERLAAAPVSDIVGLVNGNGAGGGSNGGVDWDLIFHFIAWRTAGGPVRTDVPLRLYYAVPKADLNRWMAEIQPYAVWRIRTSVLTEPLNGQMQGRITEIVGVEVNDGDLNAEAERLQMPVVIDIPQLGRMTLDRRFGWFEGEVEWCGKLVRLGIDAEPGATVPATAGVSAARALLADQSGWQNRVNAFAAARLLSLRNDNWREGDEPGLTEDDFIGRMRLESIAIGTDGRLDFWHDDGELFWGHAIHISGTIADGPTDADTPG